MLSYSVAACGVLIGAVSLVVLLVPSLLRDTTPTLQKPRVLLVAIAVRLVAGALFIVASAACSWPAAIGALGVVFLAAGFAGLFMGVERLASFTPWLVACSDTLLRSLAIVGVVFGAFIAYAA